MKIIHLSDTHINPETLNKIDTQQRFKLALNHIRDNIRNYENNEKSRIQFILNRITEEQFNRVILKEQKD